MYDEPTRAPGEYLEHEERLADAAGVLNVAHARAVEVASRAKRDGGWVGEGIQSLNQWLVIHLGVSRGRARQIATIADRVDEFPLLMAAFGRGELSVDQVYVVAAKAPAWADRHVTEFALVATVPQLQRMIRDENFDGDPDDAQPAPTPASDSLGVSWDEHGRLRLPGSLDADDGSVVEGAMHEARDALFNAGQSDATWADAIAEIARRSLASVAWDRRQRFLPQVHIHTDTGAAQLTNGVALPPSIRDYILCDAVLRPVWERDNVAYGAGRSQRSVPDRLRRLIEHRDQGCRVHGCAARHVQIHHIRHWSDGGVTESWNLISVCRHHHKLHHLGQLGIAGNADLRTMSPSPTPAAARSPAIHDHALQAAHHPNPPSRTSTPAVNACNHGGQDSAGSTPTHSPNAATNQWSDEPTSNSAPPDAIGSGARDAHR